MLTAHALNSFVLIVNPDKGRWRYHADPRDPRMFVRTWEDNELPWILGTRSYSRRIKPGDRVFFDFTSQRLGSLRGIYAAGEVLSHPRRTAQGWRFYFRDNPTLTHKLLDRPVLASDVERLLGPNYGPIRQITSDVAPAFERLLRAGSRPASSQLGDLEAARLDASDTYTEGRRSLQQHLRVERSAALREASKAYWKKRRGKLACEICRFDFERVYGFMGAGYIELHHVRPLAAANRPREATVIDLVPLCSNCHRVVHRRMGEPFSLREVRKNLRRPRRNTGHRP